MQAARRRGAEYDRLDLPGAGPVFVGGFSFAPAGGRTPEWESFAPAQMVLPEISFARSGGRAALTVTAVGDPASALARLEEIRPATMPLIDPDPVARARVVSEAPPEHFEEAVRRAVERIAAGELEKIVLARIVRVHGGRAHEPGAIFGALRDVFPSCYSFCVGTPEGAFVGASPELLVRRDGARAQTVALAGTTRRSADPAVDDHLGEQLLTSAKNRAEQAIVARRIERTLEPVSVWVTVADRPVLVKVHNVQHLGTPIRAQLAEPLPVLELAGRLHPTPGRRAASRATRRRALIPALEGIDRGWYAGAVGWTDLEEDGELCVAIRCALIRGRGRAPVRRQRHRGRLGSRPRSSPRPRRSCRRCCRCSREDVSARGARGRLGGERPFGAPLGEWNGRSPAEAGGGAG